MTQFSGNGSVHQDIQFLELCVINPIQAQQTIIVMQIGHSLVHHAKVHIMHYVPHIIHVPVDIPSLVLHVLWAIMLNVMDIIHVLLEVLYLELNVQLTNPMERNAMDIIHVPLGALYLEPNVRLTSLMVQPVIPIIHVLQEAQ